MARGSGGWHPVRSGWQLLGAAAVLGAFLALCVPLSLSVVDRAGQPIGCGSGLNPDTSAARYVDTVNQRLHVHGGAAFVASDYVGECHGLIGDRRAVAGTVGGVGTAVLLTALIAPVVAGARRSRTPALHYSPRRASMTALKSLSA
ncbi:hypothetical protein [Mycolicibacterium sp.]|uniref:hypothetical protein n=1 Tax=Mycolicibacterium sp. TaxID=2320850 RepID=UPI00355CBFA4